MLKNFFSFARAYEFFYYLRGVKKQYMGFRKYNRYMPTDSERCSVEAFSPVFHAVDKYFL